MLEKGKKILVVDDMKMARMLAIAGIAQLGYKDYVEAENGKEALKLALDSAQNIGLILADWNMPVMDGFELLQNLKKNEQTKLIPFIFISAEAEEKNLVEAEKAGAAGFIKKPVNEQSLKKALMDLFKKSMAV